MYLSRLILYPRSRQVQSELARPYQMHKTILKAFPETLPADERVLFRLDEDPHTGLLTLLVQSQHQPNWAHLSDGKNYLLPIEQLSLHITKNPVTKMVNLQLRGGQVLSFRLNANPTKRLSKTAGEDAGKRVGLFKEEDQTQWLARKLEAAGATLIRVGTFPNGNIISRQSKNAQKNTITMLGVRFEGAIQVTNPSALLQAINSGIGSGKGMGFGLLSLAPGQ
jgi:CRISPR system Cascade subunit CasE